MFYIKPWFISSATRFGVVFEKVTSKAYSNSKMQDYNVSGEVVLTLRRFPAELSEEDGRDLLSKFGASRLTIVKRNKNKNVVYATFPNEKAAENALVRLHQLRVLGRRLIVEYASESDRPNEAGSRDLELDGQSMSVSSVSLVEAVPKKTSNVRDEVQEFSRDLNAVGRSFGLDYPISSKLNYSYPPPNATTLANIGGALMVVPKFYNQVLHLMNKMNLPAPFGPQIHFPGLTFVVPDEFATDRLTREEEEKEGESEVESELESEPDESRRPDASVHDFESNDNRRRRLRSAVSSRIPRKRARLQSITPVFSTTARGDINPRPEQVFELPSAQMSKRIEFKLDVKAPEANESEVVCEQKKVAADAETETSEVPVQLQVADDDDDEPTLPSKKKLISEDELRINRLSKEEMEALPVFKNYNSGTATRRLYLKNLAKQVDEDDLRSVYQRFVADAETETFDLRLMREGRMKGQAFITFENEENARKALDKTNGFVLHGKPIVVQFARCDKDK